MFNFIKLYESLHALITNRLGFDLGEAGTVLFE
jgi:hypothetical protein